jgi:hypothetical protein
VVRLGVGYDYVGVAVYVGRPHLVGHVGLRQQIVDMILQGSSRSRFAAVHNAGGSVQEVVNVSEYPDDFALADLPLGQAEKLVFGLVTFCEGFIRGKISKPVDAIFQCAPSCLRKCLPGGKSRG